MKRRTGGLYPDREVDDSVRQCPRSSSLVASGPHPQPPLHLWRGGDYGSTGFVARRTEGKAREFVTGKSGWRMEGSVTRRTDREGAKRGCCVTGRRGGLVGWDSGNLTPRPPLRRCGEGETFASDVLNDEGWRERELIRNEKGGSGGDEKGVLRNGEAEGESRMGFPSPPETRRGGRMEKRKTATALGGQSPIRWNHVNGGGGKA